MGISVKSDIRCVPQCKDIDGNIQKQPMVLSSI